jgi:uncharacterized RDD family membrane protein YckC
LHTFHVDNHGMTTDEIGRAYAGFWRRATAFTIDGAIVGALGLALGIAMLAAAVAVFDIESNEPEPERPRQEASNDQIHPIVGIPFLIAAFIYEFGATAIGGGAGKRLLRLRVVKQDQASRPDWDEAVVRALLKTFFSFFWFIGVFSHLAMIRDPRKQTWHDRAAHTVVIRR